MNECGIQPVEYKVVIKPDEQDETIGRLKIIIAPEQARDKFALEKCEGTLIAVGGRAFQNPDWGKPTPQIGDRVYFAKYAGIRLGRDIDDAESGKRKHIEYVLCNDKDIAAIIDGEVKENAEKPRRVMK